MDILRDSSKVFAGVTAQRIITFIMLPVIARLLGPENYGIFTVAYSVCTLLVIVGSLALPASIAVSKTKRQAAERAAGISLIGILSGFIFWIIAYIMSSYLQDYYTENITNALFLMIPIFVPLGIIDISLQNYVGYLGKFKVFAIADILSPIANYTALISIYILFWKDYRSLIVAGIIQSIVRISLFLYASKNLILFGDNIFSFDMIRSLWQARNFAKFNLPSNLLNTASVQLPPVLLSIAFSTSVVGLFTMARNIVTIPTHLSSKALGKVFYPTAAREYRNTGSLTGITWTTFVYSCQLTLFPAIFTAAVATSAVPFLLGPQWSGMEPFLWLLLPMVLLNAVQTQIGIGIIFSILEQQYKILIGNAVLFIFRILPLIICMASVLSEYLTVFAYSIGGAIGYALLLGWIFLSTSISVPKAIYTWAKCCLIAALCVLPVVVASSSGQVFVLLSSFVISATSFSIVAWFRFLNCEQRSLIVSMISKIIYSKK